MFPRERVRRRGVQRIRFRGFHGRTSVHRLSESIQDSPQQAGSDGQAGVLYARDDAHKEELLKSGFSGRGSIEVSRFKGLGEMPMRDLRDTTMDPAKRTLLKVTMEDALEASQLFETLMGDEVEPRRKFIEENAKFVRNLDV